MGSKTVYNPPKIEKDDSFEKYLQYQQEKEDRLQAQADKEKAEAAVPAGQGRAAPLAQELVRRVVAQEVGEVEALAFSAEEVDEVPKSRHQMMEDGRRAGVADEEGGAREQRRHREACPLL